MAGRRGWKACSELQEVRVEYPGQGGGELEPLFRGSGSRPKNWRTPGLKNSDPRLLALSQTIPDYPRLSGNYPGIVMSDAAGIRRSRRSHHPAASLKCKTRVCFPCLVFFSECGSHHTTHSTHTTWHHILHNAHNAHHTPRTTSPSLYGGRMDRALLFHVLSVDHFQNSFGCFGKVSTDRVQVSSTDAHGR